MTDEGFWPFERCVCCDSEDIKVKAVLRIEPLDNPEQRMLALLPFCAPCARACFDEANIEERAKAEGALGCRWDKEVRPPVLRTLYAAGLDRLQAAFAMPIWRRMRLDWKRYVEDA